MGLDAAKASGWNSSKTVNTVTLSQYLQAVKVDCQLLQILCQFIQKCTKNIVNTYESDKESQKNIENVSRLCYGSNITGNVTGNNTGNVTKTEPSH